ncbi:MAG: metallophosphoesterase family protein [Pseudomonadota bacterium]|nr:metallophosphoesterase family protein [Pseudomonadota bacterium]
MPRRIGLIADTHGLLRPEALAALAGAETVLHAGDIGGAAILDALAAIAPVHAVLGNNDTEPWAAHLPEALRLRFEGIDILLVHDVADAVPEGARVIVSGHSHRPGVTAREGRLWVNPGSAGPRRFALPVTIGWLHVDGDTVTAELVELVVPGPKRRGAPNRAT